MKYWIFLISLALVQATNTEFSELESKLKKQSNEFITLRQKIENGEKRLGELDVQQGSVRVRIKDMKQEFELLSVKLKQTESRIRKIIRDIKALERKSSISKKKFGKHQAKFFARLNHVYKNRNSPFLQILLNAKTSQDFSNRLNFYKRIVAADSGNFRELKNFHKEMGQNLKEIQTKRAELERLSQRLINQKNSLLNRIQTDRDYLEKIAVEQEQLVSRAQKMDKSSKFLKRQIDNLKFAHQQMSEEVEATKVIKKNIKKIAKNSLSWPLRQPFQISRNFGRQIEGSATIFLPGIDITTNQSRNVFASEDGIVIYKGLPAGESSPTYGKVVMIAHEDHEGKFVTLYGNLSNIQVTLDQYVRRGEKIAKISEDRHKSISPAGNPRLYYQVIVDLEPKNPIEWLERQQGT
ncbi:MAG: peptidoglycan DD-metalloendopeptidase family protein [bacterium]|nr:peptidoglycan DD-metalloendopeptidase family protein [bacterium]